VVEDIGTLSIRFRHPSKDLSFLSEELGLNCNRCWKAGSPRQTPKGDPLPGTYKDSYWYSRIEISRSDNLGIQTLRAIEILERSKATAIDIKSTGGAIEIYLQLPGAENNGGEIKSENLKRLSDLGVDLLIEVFPDI